MAGSADSNIVELFSQGVCYVATREFTTSPWYLAEPV